MLTTLLSGFTIALAFAAPPGPVAMETIRHGLRGGFFPALRVQLGSILGDLAWCMLALFGLAPILQADWIRLPVAAAGSIILVALGIAAFRDAILGSEALFRENAGRPGGSFRIGAVISLGNPMAPAFWISIGGAMAAAGTLDSDPVRAVWFAAGYLAAVLLWAFLMAGVIRLGQHLILNRFFRIINIVCGSLMVYFGISLALASFGGWFGLSS